MEAFWAVFTFGGSGPALTAHGSLDLKQEIQIQIQVAVWPFAMGTYIPEYPTFDFGRSIKWGCLQILPHLF
jgi:hypothetical protein